MKKILAIAVLAAGLAASSHADAARQYADEYFVYDANGYTLGSYTYPCNGGIYIEGTIEGAEVIEGFRTRCISAPGPQGGNCWAQGVSGLGWQGAILKCAMTVSAD